MADVGNNIVSSLNRLMTTDDDDSSSVHQVVSNDNLLIEILLRLPVVSLFYFKSVSKRWLCLITSSFFNLRASRFPKINPPCGFLLQKTRYGKTRYSDTYKHDFVSLNSRIPQSKKSKSVFTFGCFGLDASNVEILQSCNGLVLCVNRTNQPVKIYVYNPSINMFKMLPQLDGLSKIDRFVYSVRLAFDPKKSPHYKVLHIRVIAPGLIQSHVYSSETGCWRKDDNSFPIEWSYMQFERGVYWNDAIHWINNIMNRIFNFKLDVAHPRITSTKPPETLGGDSYQELFESGGCLLLAYSRDPYSKHLKIYEKRNGYCGWSARYAVKYEDSIEAFFKTWNMSTVGFCFNVLFMMVGEREEGSFVVMNLNGKVVKYNLLSKTLRMVCNIDKYLTKDHTFPFIASLAGV